MLNPQAMSKSEEQQCRDKAFYLLKKYTSYTYLDYAAKRYKAFLDGYGTQLSDLTRVQPEPDLQRLFDVQVADGTYQKYYGWFLDGMAIIEEGLKLLRTTADKAEAYRHLRRDRLRSDLTGRGADYLGIEHDPFFIALGMPFHRYYGKDKLPAPPADGAMQRFYEGLRCFSQLDEILVDYSSTSYNYLFESLSSSDFPAFFLLPCPDHNTNPAGQIWSDRVIPITGIWEPWFANEGFFQGLMNALTDKNTAKPTGVVGCPKYFLAGVKACRYRTEPGYHRCLPRVAWRLLWEDVRYLDGTIPTEEAEYLRSTSPLEACCLPSSQKQ